MADVLFELTSGSDTWATAEELGISARSVHLTNRGAYPVRVRWASSGDAVVRLAAGASRLFIFPRSAVKTTIALYGIGGASAVDVEASTDELQTHLGSASGSLVLADLSSATPAALGSASSGSAATAARGDHVHALPAGSTLALAPAASASAGVSTELARVDHVHPMGTLSATLDAEVSDKRRITFTGLGTSVLRLVLWSEFGVQRDGTQQALDLVTGTSAAWSLGSGSVTAAVITPTAGVVAVDINDKTFSFSGSVFLESWHPSTGAYRVDEAAFT